jgi:ABC-type branched-subunit amino acid transport system ATPase component/branched-subunit amino acid ABC-type transport system permease component
MERFLQFAILGLASGAIFSLLAQGVVMVYRGSGLLNFAQGAMAMVGAYAYYDLCVRHGLPLWLGAVIAVVICAVLGAILHLALLGPMRQASSLARVVATLGVVVVLQAAAYLRYGIYALHVPSLLPTGTVYFAPGHHIPVGQDRIIILGTGIFITAALTAVYRYTAVGRLTTTVAENHVLAATVGYSPDVIAARNWAFGSAVAGLGGVLIAPITSIDPTTMILLVLPAMSAALVANFKSFPVTLAAALLIGIAESEVTTYVSSPGWSTAAPFLAVIILLVVRGRGLPLRSLVLDRLPRVGPGRIRVVPLAAFVIVLAYLITQSGPDWAGAFTTSISLAIICMSVVLITGYAGQLSLAQYILAGLGALIAAKLSLHMPFVPALLIAVVITAAIGAVIGLPALRTRGVTLTIVTIGLASVIAGVILLNSDYTGGITGITPPVPHLFGYNIDPFLHAKRYGIFALISAVAISLGVTNLRRGPVGRMILATRSNERGAASVGVNVAAAKLYAFTLGAGIAAYGGIVLAFYQPSIAVGNFDVFTSIYIVAVTVTGGVGYVTGAWIGSTMIVGGVVSQLFAGWPGINNYLPLIGGAALILMLRFAPDGQAELNQKALAPLLTRYGRLSERIRAMLPHRRAGAPGPAVAEARERERTTHPATLIVDDLSVTFGGVRAVQGVSIDVRPGEIHGLIGPNGAGKTTLIDGVTGFVKCKGRVRLGDKDVTSLSARKRAHAGLSRSFQSLELFTDLTVLENLAVACDRQRSWRYVTDLFRPGQATLTAAGREAMQEFGLFDVADRLPGEISFGQRKAVAIARAIAREPAVLLLDEPAAGLDDDGVAELSRLIRHIAHHWGIGMLLVEHKIDMIMDLSDRVTVIQQGKVLTSGNPQEVRANAQVIEAYLGEEVEQALQQDNDPDIGDGVPVPTASGETSGRHDAPAVHRQRDNGPGM